MYPKVKVRAEDPDDRRAPHERNWSALLSLKDIQFLSLQDSCFPVRRHQDVSPPATARIPKTYVPSAILPPVSAPVDDALSLADKKGNFDEDENRPNIRASSVPRPRAVLSSPENDAVIGNKNRKAAPPSPLRSHKLIQNRHAQCKVIPSQMIDEGPMNTKKSKDTADMKSDLKGKKGSRMLFSSRRRTLPSDK